MTIKWEPVVWPGSNFEDFPKLPLLTTGEILKKVWLLVFNLAWFLQAMPLLKDKGRVSENAGSGKNLTVCKSSDVVRMWKC